MRESPTKHNQHRRPAFPGYHNRQSAEQKHFDANHQVLSVFESHHSPLQRARDAQMIAALIGPGIVQHYPHTGETKLEKERAFFPSRTHLEPVKAEQGKPTYEIAGGWVTRQEAIMELAEPASVVVELPVRYPAEEAA